MTEKAKAAVFTKERKFEIEEFDLPKLQTGEVLVKVECSTVCGSDLHTFQGHRSTPTPTILGHEIMGHIIELPTGDALYTNDGKELKIGDKITWSVAANCGSCFFCQNGLPQKCKSLFKYGHEKITDKHPLSGGLASHCYLAPGTAIFHLPEDIPNHAACPANCATATAACAARLAEDLRDKHVLVQGAGLLGITAAAMASINGASNVIVCNLESDRLENAKLFGATQISKVKENTQDLSTIVKDLTNGRGVDIAFEMSGAPEAAELGIELLRIGGCYILAGATHTARPLSISAETIVRKMITIKGMHNYIPEDLQTAINFLENYHHKFPFSTMVSKVFKLSEVEAAFNYAVNSQSFRVAIHDE